jgi:hypothetical protein
MRYYEDVTSHRKRSVLPPELQRSLVRLRDGIRASRIDKHELTAVIFNLSRLRADTYLHAAHEIADIAELYRWPESKWLFLRIVQSRSDDTLLSKTPGLEYLYLFHHNGYLREKALAKIDGPLESAFYFNSIAYRLNDWVEPVRRAALTCAARVFPKTSAGIIADAAFVLLEHMRHWQRGAKEAKILEETFSRSDVVVQLATHIKTATTGSPSRVLTNLLRRDQIDVHLLDLSQSALQPPVRALALKSLLWGYARWPDGFRREWIDKSMGLSRRVCAYQQRELSYKKPIASLIAQGAADKSAMVRRVAADSLVQHRKTLSNLDELVSMFARDKSASVRERADFIIRERAEGLARG